MISLVYRPEARESKFELMKRLIKDFSEGRISYNELWAGLENNASWYFDRQSGQI